MQPIMFDLIDGVENPQTKVIEKRVVMRKQTMQDELEIAADQDLQAIVSKKFTISDNANPVEQKLAVGLLRQYNLILFKKLVLSIGAVDRNGILANKLLEKLTVDDFQMMQLRLHQAVQKVIAVETVYEVLDRLVTNDVLRQEIKKGLETGLGEG